MKPRKKEKRRSSLKVSPNSLKNKKEKFLARWTDGLFYFVKVKRVSDANKTCSVEFEDKSTAQVHFKDLLEAHDDGDAECHFCGDAHPAPSNVMVTCSNCERVYHQHCHVPRVEDGELNQKFVCRICVFASCAQTGGAKTSGHLAEKYAVMKRTLPYELKGLTWDASHTSNAEQSFCYCGGPGCWYNKMLQCCRCKQWFHEACLQCLKEQLLIGDHFYVFACAHCNHGKEFLYRMEMKWLDIVYVSLFHLTMAMVSRYVDAEDVATCIMNHGSSFRLKEVLNGHHGSFLVIQEHVLKALRENSQIFVCAAELRKKNTLFGIRERVPRVPNSYCVPGPGEKITKESLQHASSSSKRVTFSPSKCHSPVVCVAKGIKKAPSSGPRVRESKMVKVARVKSEHNYCTPLKCPDGRHRNCRSNSPSSSSSSTEGSDSSFVSADFNLFDSNNNSSPSKQYTPRVLVASSPPSPDLEVDGDADADHDKEEGQTEDVVMEEARSQTRGRSRSLSSSRDLKHRSKNSDKNNGKRFERPSEQNHLVDVDDDHSEMKIANLDLDITPSSSDQLNESNEETKAEKPFWSLDIAFPQPASFSGANHPFLTEYEQENLRQKRHHFETELERLASAMIKPPLKISSSVDNWVERGSLKHPLSFPPAPGLKDLAGFKGELRSLIKTQASVAPMASASSEVSVSGLSSGACTSKDFRTKSSGSAAHPDSSTPKSTDISPERLTPKSRRKLRAANTEACCSNTNGDGASTPSPCPSESSPAPLFVNGVKISPIMLSRFPSKKSLGSPSTSTSTSISSKSSPTLALSGSGRSARHQRNAAEGGREKSSAVKSSPSSSKKAKEEEKAAQKRFLALQRCLKNLSPTCGFHFPVLEQTHPAVANSAKLSPLALPKSEDGASWNSGSGDDVKASGSYSHSSHPSSASPLRTGISATSSSTSHGPQGRSPSTSPLQAKTINGSSSSITKSHELGGMGKRGRKRTHDSEDAAGGKIKTKAVDQENVRRSHRSRCAVNRFQANRGGKGLMAAHSATSHAGYHGLAEQYDVISLRVGPSGAVEYLIDWWA